MNSPQDRCPKVWANQETNTLRWPTCWKKCEHIMSHMHWSLYKALLQVPSKGWLDDHCLTPDFNGSTNCSLLNIHFNTEHDDSSLELGWIGCILLIIGVYKPTTKSSPPTSNKPFGTLPWKLHSPSAGSSPCVVFIALAMTGSHPKVTRKSSSII